MNLSSPHAHTHTHTLQKNFDFSHTQYLACGYGKDCKYGVACTRAHSTPPGAEIAYWNWLQPLTGHVRRHSRDQIKCV
jgi:hypothetical protein